MIDDVSNDYVICKICGKKVKRLTYNHLKIHNITLVQYKEIYPNSRTIAENTRQKYSTAAYNLAMSKTKQERIDIGKKLSKCWWDKYNNDSVCQIQYHSKLSESISKSINDCKLNTPEKYAEINKKRSEVRKSRFNNNQTSDIFRNNSRKGAINLWNKMSDEERNAKLNLLKQGNEIYWSNMTEEERVKLLSRRFNNKSIKVIIDNNTYIFRSKFEYNVAMFLTKNDIDFQYESIIIQLNNTKYHKYHLTDFYIPKINLILECKSLYHKQYTQNQILEDIKIKRDSAINSGYLYYVIWYDKKENIENQLNRFLIVYNILGKDIVHTVTKVTEYVIPETYSQ